MQKIHSSAVQKTWYNKYGKCARKRNVDQTCN